MADAQILTEATPQLSRYQVPNGCALVIFGASGDLTKRKLLPALYALAHDGLLPDKFSVVGFARREKSHEAFREEMRAAVEQFSRFRPIKSETWDRLAQALYYVAASFDDPAGYERLRALLGDLDRQHRTGGNRVYYLATPPGAYGSIVARLGAAGLVSDAWNGPHEGDTARKDQGWSRIIIEKPFGRDLASARALNAEIHRVFRERQVYRIDHYLGKETVQNILTFRFGNSIFEPLWNRRYVDHVQLLVAEDLGVESRGGYYDTAGAMRDMVQNHMLQLLSLVAMEPPATFEPDAVRDEKVKVLRAIRPIPADRAGEADRPRAVHQRDPGREEGPGLRGRARGGEGHGDGDLRGPAPGDRQLALGRGAVLPADRKGVGEAGHGGHDPVPAAATLAVRARGS